jgi:hypothetical protein
MTPKQIEIVKNKIAKIKQTLAAEKRKFGWYDDSGIPDFLFEWTIILFKNGRIQEAEKKALQTFCSNTYLFDKYFGRQIIQMDKWEGSNLENSSFTTYLDYPIEQAELADFSKWLDTVFSTQNFITRSNTFIDIQKRLKTEGDEETRLYLENVPN